MFNIFKKKTEKTSDLSELVDYVDWALEQEIRIADVIRSSRNAEYLKIGEPEEAEAKGVEVGGCVVDISAVTTVSTKRRIYDPENPELFINIFTDFYKELHNQTTHLPTRKVTSVQDIYDLAMQAYVDFSIKPDTIVIGDGFYFGHESTRELNKLGIRLRSRDVRDTSFDGVMLISTQPKMKTFSMLLKGVSQVEDQIAVEYGFLQTGPGFKLDLGGFKRSN
jgi:hypothetical protein